MHSSLLRDALRRNGPKPDNASKFTAGVRKQIWQHLASAPDKCKHEIYSLLNVQPACLLSTLLSMCC